MRFVQKKHYSFSPIDCRAKNATNNMYMYSSTDSITHCVSCVHTVHKLYNEQAYSTSRSNVRTRVRIIIFQKFPVLRHTTLHI